jgi:hypothetical protein
MQGFATAVSAASSSAVCCCSLTIIRLFTCHVIRVKIETERIVADTTTSRVIRVVATPPAAMLSPERPVGASVAACGCLHLADSITSMAVRVDLEQRAK